MPSIKKNLLYSFILTSSNYVFPLLVYPYVSRVLGVDKIGTCNFIDSIIQYFVLISMFGITSIGIREIAKAKVRQTDLNEVYSSLFTINAIFTSIALAALFVVIFFVPSLQEFRKLLFIGVLKVVSNFFLMEWLFKGLEDFKYITVRTLIVKLLYVASIFIFIHSQEDYVTYYLLTVLMITVNSIFNGFYSRRFVSFSFKGITFKPFLPPILIMGCYALMTSMYTTFNTAYLGFVAGEVQVGYYTTAMTLYGALLSLFSAFTGVMLPRMSSLLAENRHDRFKELLGKSADILFSFSFPFVILFMVFAPEIINIYAGKGYEGAIVPMQISMPLMIIIGYEQIIITQGLLPLDKNKAVLINAVIGACIGVAFSVLLVGRFKSVGSASVWALSETAVLISASIFMRRYINFHFPYKTFLKQLLAYLPILLPLLLIQKNVPDRFLSLVIAGVTAVAYTFILQRFVFHQTEIEKLTGKLSKLISRS